MLKQSGQIRVTSFILLAVSGALCQTNLSADRPQGLAFNGSDSPEVQRQEIDASRPLPDAPSAVQSPSQGEGFRTLGNEASSPLFGVSSGIVRETEPGRVTPRPQPNLTIRYQAAQSPERSSPPGKDPHAPLVGHKLLYLRSTSTTFMGRATYAASRILFTRDASGKGTPNTSYFLGVLASAASARPTYFTYWVRSPLQTFNNFGSTIGGDIGTNILHEFEPGIRQMIKGLTPKFVSRIEGRITHDLTRIGFASIPAK